MTGAHNLTEGMKNIPGGLTMCRNSTINEYSISIVEAVKSYFKNSVARPFLLEDCFLHFATMSFLGIKTTLSVSQNILFVPMF